MEVKINVPSLFVKRIFWPVWGAIVATKAIIASWKGDKKLLLEIGAFVSILLSILMALALLFSLLAASLDDAFFFFTRNIGGEWPYENYVMNWGIWFLFLVLAIMLAGFAYYCNECRWPKDEK